MCDAVPMPYVSTKGRRKPQADGISTAEQTTDNLVIDVRAAGFDIDPRRVVAQCVHLLFKEVCREAMPQRVHRHALVDVRRLGGGMNGAVQLSRAPLIERIEPGNQPPAIGHLALRTDPSHHIRRRSSNTGESIA